MADSIAKVAVVITGDASPLAKATGDASQIVRRFDHDTSTAFSNSVQGAKLVTAAFHGVEGSLRGLSHLAHVSFGTAAGLLAIAGIAKSTFELAAAADELNVKLGASKLDTWAGQWKRLSENVSTAAGLIGQPLAEAAREASSAFADLAQSFNEWLQPGITAEIELAVKLTKEYKEKQEAAKKAAEEQRRANKEAQQAQEKERDALLAFKQRFIDRGDDIRKNVLTPAEKLRDTFLELRQLMAGGFIDEETATRAGQKAVDELRKVKDEISRPDSGTAAVNRFTTAGFSAVQSGKRELERIADLQRQEVEAAKRAEDQRRVMIEVLRGNQPVVIMEGEPP